MKNKTFFLCLCVALCFSLQAQNDKLRIAVLDPTSSGTGIDEGTKMAVREIISSTFVNTGKYTIVERSLLEKVMNEQAFSNSSAVNDSQAAEIGRLAGASKIVLSVITLAGGRNMLSIKLVDVNTANVEKQKIQVISADELLGVVEPLTMELMGEESVAVAVRQTPISAAATKNPTPVSQVATTPSQTSTISNMDRLVARGMSVYQNNKKLTSNEVKQKMWVNQEALDLYFKGKSRNKTGNILLIAGSVVTVCGIGALYVGSEDENDAVMAAGALSSAVGIGAVTYGFLYRIAAKQFVQSSVNTYNRGNHTSQVEVEVGLTQNGIGLVMRF